MKYNRYYGGLIWTNHALERLKQRGLSQDSAWQAFHRPDSTQRVKQGAIEYKRKDADLLISLIAKQNQKQEWVVISAWVDPPLPNSPDAKNKIEYEKYQRASSLGKFWLTFKKQIGI